MQLLCQRSIVDSGSLTMQDYDVSSELADLEGFVEFLDEMFGCGVVPLKFLSHKEVA